LDNSDFPFHLQIRGALFCHSFVWLLPVRCSVVVFPALLMLITACVNSLICVNFLNIIFCDYNYYILQEKDELLEARRRKLSPLTSYDAQKRLDHCSERGEPVTLQFQKSVLFQSRVFTKKKYESLQQLLCPSTGIIH
ncbi:hypothetical protein T10_2849, partial [Trichinella papuae]